MKKKNNNNLIAIKYNDGDMLYFTSINRVGMKLGIAPASVKWAIEHNNVLTDVEGKVFTVVIVDGSEVPYKLINN
jgi:hypothetical protein